MVGDLGVVTLRGGRKYNAARVGCPDLEWAGRIERMLMHKGDPWNTQNRIFLENEVGIENTFYLLHEDGVPFSNITLSVSKGIGVLAHVWTIPEKRNQGASTALLEFALSDFASRNGKALYLYTDYESAAYRMYERFGFRSVVHGSGHMGWFAEEKEDFERDLFRASATANTALGWPQWNTAPALFMAPSTGIVRVARFGIFGQRSPQADFLPFVLQKQTAEDPEERFLVLETKASKVVVGVGIIGPHPIWEDVALLDVFCHDDYWDGAGGLLSQLDLPRNKHLVAYSDTESTRKNELLKEVGLHETSTLANRLRRGEGWFDALLFEKTH